MVRLPADLYHADRNTARPTRARFAYQDECVALRCVANLVSGEVTAVVVEWSTDYIAVMADGDLELVSVKHRDPGQGDWPMSEFQHVLRDLHLVWRRMGERCRCSFASNAALNRDAVKKLDAGLVGYLDAPADEVARFERILAVPDPPLPRRSEITAVGVRDMAGALSLLDRDPRYAEECYRALVSRIASVGTEEPDSPERRIARLTGSLRAVADRSRPRLDDHILQMTDLKTVVLDTHEECVRRPPHRFRVAQPSSSRTDHPAAENEPWHGGSEVQVDADSYLIHAPVDMTTAPDGSYREQRASARRLTRRQIDVRMIRLDIVRDGRPADDRRAQLVLEAILCDSIPGLPAVVDRAEDRSSVTFATAMPNGKPLPAFYGPAPYPPMALDTVLLALPTVAHSLGRLHDAGRAHRSLHPETLIFSGDRLCLRDAGLAAVPAVAGEGHSDYRAPEQDRPVLHPPGSATDVYQIAAIVYHLATGLPPDRNPAPLSLLRPDLVADLDGPLSASLAATPADRPSLTDLVAGLSAVLQARGTVAC